MTGKPRPTSQGDQALEGPGGPSHSEADQALGVPEEPSRPQESKKEYGEPIVFVGGKKHTEIKEESEKEDQEESEKKDEYQCFNCNHIQGTPFTDCPRCGAKNEWEFEYYCSECGHGFNGNLVECPNCGDKFD